MPQHGLSAWGFPHVGSLNVSEGEARARKRVRAAGVVGYRQAPSSSQRNYSQGDAVQDRGGGRGADGGEMLEAGHGGTSGKAGRSGQSAAPGLWPDRTSRQRCVILPI